MQHNAQIFRRNNLIDFKKALNTENSFNLYAWHFRYTEKPAMFFQVSKYNDRDILNHKFKQNVWIKFKSYYYELNVSLSHSLYKTCNV